jgi:hypothetical protein
MNEVPLSRYQHVNPYIAGSPVTGTEMFYGREDVFAFVRRNLIGRHRDTPVVLYGQRRTGKTSVLYQLPRHLDPSYRCIFVDLHSLNLAGMSNLMLGIANSISRGLQRDHQVTVGVPERAAFLADPRSAFETMFLDEIWSALGKDHLVLALDEAVRLDEEVKAGQLEHEVFSYLRHLMQHYPRLNFIFSLGSGLEQMEKDYAFLFSVSLYHRISFLELADARNLISHPVRDHYQVTPAATAKILQITSGHPYYTQLVCHCLFDGWSRSPKPVMTNVDVDAVLAEAIELGSANLTYVWEDSTSGERALMAGMAAAMRNQPGPVTIDAVQDAWRKVRVSLPERQLTRAFRSLAGREVVASAGQAYSFAVDLQRLWLDKHRRLAWVRDELAETIEQWNRSTAQPRPVDAIRGAGTVDTDPIKPKKRRVTGRVRYRATAVAAIVLAGYLTVAAAAHIPPFSPRTDLPQGLMQLLPGDLYQHQGECHASPPPSQWSMPGPMGAVSCIDPRLPGGTIHAYQFASISDFRTAWRNFNQWWKFPAARTGTTCPPKETSQGKQVFGNVEIPEAVRETVECGIQALSPGVKVPAFAWAYPTSNALVIAQGASGSTISALNSWVINSPTPASALTSNSAPPPSSTSQPAASVCQSDGTGCTKAGTYTGPGTLISRNYSGFKIVWTSSVVQPYPAGVPLYWTAHITYTNISSSTLTLGCPGNWADASNSAERMAGGDGDDGMVPAEDTMCSNNPSKTVTVPPGGTFTAFATFHNVPWPGSSVAIQWGDAGTSAYVNPFNRPRRT